MHPLVLAHGADGLAGEAVPVGVLYGLVTVGVLLAAVGLRARGPEPVGGPAVAPASIDGSEVGPWPGDALPAPARVAGQVVGVTALALLLAVGWAGSDLSGLNPLPLVLLAVGWWLVPVLSLLLGDWWRVVDPFDALASVVDRVRGAPGPGVEGLPAPADEADDWWVPAALLASFAWLATCWLDGLRPRPMAAWLTLLTAVMVAGAVRGGRAWVRRSSPLAVLCGAVAAASPVDWGGGRVRLRSPFAGIARRAGGRRTLAVLVVVLGATVWEVVAGTVWWADLVGTGASAASTGASTAGLAGSIAVVAALWWGVTRLVEEVAAARGADDLHERLDGDMALALAGVAAVAPLIHQVSTALIYLQDLLALASDPFSRGWDVLGTLHRRTDESLIATATANWVQLTLLAAGLAVMLVGGWDRLTARLGVVAVDAVWVLAAATTALGCTAVAMAVT